MSAVDDCLTRLPEPERREFERIREIVRQAAPGVEEGKSYGLPAFKYRQRPLLGFRASKNPLSVIPFSASAVEVVRCSLDGFDLSKGTIRFSPGAPVPGSAIERLLRKRMAEIYGTA